jgi:hypothetical protein
MGKCFFFFQISDRQVVLGSFSLYCLFTWWCLTILFLNSVSVILWRQVLLVEETGVPWENYRPVASHLQTLSHNLVLSAPRHERNSRTSVVIHTDCIGSCESNYHAITAIKALLLPISRMHFNSMYIFL